MVSEKKKFENVDGRTDGRTPDAGVIGILIAHLGAFGSGELKIPGSPHVVCTAKIQKFKISKILTVGKFNL